MTTLADQTIAALRSGHDALTTAVRGFSPDDLVRPSGAAEWQVHQVLSHLGSGAEISLATLRAAEDGAPNPGGDFNGKVWERWDGMEPAEHASAFLESNRVLVEAYEALDAAARESLRIDFGFLPAPIDVATAGRFRLSEFALHQWDVAVAFDPATPVTPEAVPLLLDQTAGMLAWTAKPEALDGRDVTLTLRLREPDRSHGLRLAEKIEITEPPAESDGELSLPAESWLRLAAGRLGPQYTPDGVHVTGPLTLDDLRAVFPGF
jgi:uncharacterized protein (TIGR03083 family)